MNTSAAGLRVLVTAGAAGIGRAIAQTFVAHGARVHICDVDRGALDGARSACCRRSPRASPTWRARRRSTGCSPT